jgi:hypothetical protein
LPDQGTPKAISYHLPPDNLAARTKVSPMSVPLFDRSRLLVKPLSERIHDLDVTTILDLHFDIPTGDGILHSVSLDLIRAKRKRGSIILFMGAHVVRSGTQKYIIDMMERGYITCIAMNGAGIIHDFEFALIGATTENVARYVRTGEFGLWKETAMLNDIIHDSFIEDQSAGLGASIGTFIEHSDMPYRSVSLLAAASRLGIPATVHVGIGYDIIHEHPNCDGMALGALSYNDFLTLATAVSGLENGVVMNFGSAVMAPEVYLKALSMARNVARQEGREISHFTVLVCDLVELREGWANELPRNDPLYYFRPLKTMLIRTVAEGGTSYYLRGDHRQTIPGLWTHINMLEASCG